jgi:hypothetical protein
MVTSIFMDYPYKALGQLPFEKVYQLLVPLIPGGAFLFCVVMVYRGLPFPVGVLGLHTFKYP